MKKLKTVLVTALATLLLTAGCAFMQPTKITKPCTRKVWFSQTVHELPCLGGEFSDDGKIWKNVGEIVNPELPHVLVIFWDFANDCAADIANIYILHKATDKDNPTGVDIYALRGPIAVKHVLRQIASAGHLDAIKWLDCEPHSKE